MDLELNTVIVHFPKHMEGSCDDVRCYQDLCVLLLTAPAFAVWAGVREQRFACCMSAAFGQKDNSQQKRRNGAHELISAIMLE